MIELLCLHTTKNQTTEAKLDQNVGLCVGVSEFDLQAPQFFLENLSLLHSRVRFVWLRGAHEPTIARKHTNSHVVCLRGQSADTLSSGAEAFDPERRRTEPRGTSIFYSAVFILLCSRLLNKNKAADTTPLFSPSVNPPQ